MAQLQFDHMLSSIETLSPEQMRRLRGELDAKLAKAAKPASGSLGAMRDASDELDVIAEQAIRNRHERPLRLSSGE